MKERIEFRQNSELWLRKGIAFERVVGLQVFSFYFVVVFSFLFLILGNFLHFGVKDFLFVRHLVAIFLLIPLVNIIGAITRSFKESLSRLSSYSSSMTVKGSIIFKHTWFADVIAVFVYIFMVLYEWILWTLSYVLIDEYGVVRMKMYQQLFGKISEFGEDEKSFLGSEILRILDGLQDHAFLLKVAVVTIGIAVSFFLCLIFIKCVRLSSIVEK